MDFSTYKRDILQKPDKSRKGCIDAKIKTLCTLINNHPDFVTLSSCSGRIALLQLAQNNKKPLSRWLLVTHELASVTPFQKALKHYRGKEQVYFKQEGAIVHVATRTLEQAERLITLARENGFKRSGIITTKRKIVVELICMEHLSVPVFHQRLFITDEYLSTLLALANTKLRASWKALTNLEIALKKYLGKH